MHTSEAAIYTAILITGSCISIIILYFAVTLVLQQKRYARLNNKLIGAEIEQLENERKKISADIHDGFGPMLFAARMKFAAMEPTNNKALKLQQEGLAHLDTLMQNMRNFSKELIPASLLSKGLVPALEEFFNSIRSTYSLELSFNVSNLPVIPETKTIHIYRIVQEIIFNTTRHAKASCLTIEIYCENERLVISTADDGQGFDYNNRGLSAGQGLQNINNRVEILKGDFHLNTGRNRGACFLISIPFNNE